MARKEFQTLTEQMFYILLILRNPHHGYEIMHEIEVLTNGRVKVGAGTLYALLSRFEEEHFIYIVNDNGRKKVYQLTTEGKDILKEEYSRLQSMIEDYLKKSNDVV